MIDHVKFVYLDMLEEIIAEHKESFDKTELRDFIDAFLLELENNSHESFTVSNVL